MSTDSVNERLIWLLNISRSMLATSDIDELLELITESFIELAEADRGFLLLRDRDTGLLVRRVARLTDGGPVAGADSRISTVAERVVRERKPVFVTDTTSDTDLAKRNSVHDLGLKMMVCVPLMSETDVIGALYADGACALDKVFTHTNRSTFEMLADHAAAAIENARMFQNATNDPITGLPNSSFFLLELARYVQTDDGNPIAVALLDLDHFKRVNTAGGAEAGDKALIDIATTLSEIFRTDGMVARYGSDKFAILLPPDDDIAVGLRLRDVAERARAAIAAKRYSGVDMSVCIGGVTVGIPTKQTAADIVAAADDQLNLARKEGIGRLSIRD